jgi:hypothetical protein
MSYEEDLRAGIKKCGIEYFREYSPEGCELCDDDSFLMTDGLHVICESCLDEIANEPDDAYEPDEGDR